MSGRLSFIILAALLSGWASGADHRLIYRISLAALKEAANTGRLDHIRYVLQEVGGFAITGLGTDYAFALGRVESGASACLRYDGAALQVTLQDGTVRRSHVQASEDATASSIFPDCVAADMKTITQTFDKVEASLVGVLGRLLGNASLEVLDQGRRLGLLDLPTKTHLHVYSAAAGQQSSLQQQQDSLPFHVDNGLYLLVTPAPVLPLRLRTKTGQSIWTGLVGPDAVIFLLGRGLTDWLLPVQPAAEAAFTPGRHAVPSLVHTGVTSRTVVARMRVAPLEAVPAAAGRNGEAASKFGDLFLDGRVAPSVASLCYYGGPFVEQKASLRARRNAAACWPHTEKC
jgi:hypothetical protein